MGRAVDTGISVEGKMREIEFTACPCCGCLSKDGEEILRCPKCNWTKEFMDYKEVGKLVGVTAITIRRWEKSGYINVTRVGEPKSRHALFHRSEYNRLMGLTPDNTPI